MANDAQQTVSDDLVRKIQLLLNLAERSAGNEQEAAAAMAKAQELLAKYNLDMATVQDAVVKGGPNATKAEVKREKADAKRNATYQWTQDLYRAVAEANYCKYWAAEVRVESESTGKVRWVKRHRVLGRVENTTAVLMMGDYLYATIMRLLPYDKSSWLSADAMAWCDGCVARLTARIRAKAEAMRTPDYAAQGEAGYCTAIAVRDMAAAEEAANYEAEFGAGSWAKKLAREAASRAHWDKYEAGLAAEIEREKAARAALLASETPEQRAKREKKEAKEAARREAASAKYWERAWRSQERESRRRASSAYRAGAAAGEDIGLDAQVGAGEEAKGLR